MSVSDVAGATRELSEFVAALGPRSIPPSTLHRAARIVADTLGVGLAGSAEAEAGALRERLPSSPHGATIWASGWPRASRQDAAMVNATQIAFLELDEGARPTGHPAAHVLPPLLAQAELLGTSGMELLTAFIAGYEVQARIQRAARLRWDVHPHGNFGIPAAVASMGRLFGWDADAVFRGLTVAAGLPLATAWEPCLSGATVRNAFIGVASQVAFRVVELVESGFTGDHEALAVSYGRVLGEGFDAAPLTEDLGAAFAVDVNYFKFHAACALTHPALDALVAALGVDRRAGCYPAWEAGIDVRPEDVMEVDVRVPERFARLDAPAKANQLSSKFSIPYAVAAFLVTGGSGPGAFRGANLHDRRLRDVEARVRVTGDPSLTDRWPAEAAASVRLRLADGRILQGSVANPFGSSDRVPSDADLEAKFRFLTDGVLSQGEQDALWSDCLRLDVLDNVQDLFPK